VEEYSTEKKVEQNENLNSEEELRLAQEQFGQELFLSNALVSFLIDLGMSRSTAERRMKQWKEQRQLFRIKETQYLTFNTNSELVKTTALETAKHHFGNRLFKPGELVEFLKHDRKMSGKAANAKIAQWKKQKVLFAYQSPKSGNRDTGKLFNFDKSSIPSKFRTEQAKKH
jgi:hypothetical protein